MSSRFPVRLLPAFCAAGLALASLARGQTAPDSTTATATSAAPAHSDPTPDSIEDEAIRLSPFEVKSDAQSDYGVTSLAGATVLNTPIREIPQSISVLTAQFMEAIGAVNMQDAMIWVTGVSPRQNVMDGTVIRSFLTQRTYNDGIRNFNGNYQSDLADFDRIEIIKGPAAAVVGTGEPGGYVNRVTKKPLEDSQGSISLQTGSWDFFRTVVDSTGPVTDDKSVLYRTVFAYQNNNTQIKGQSQERTLFDPSASWKPYENTTVLFQYEYQDAHDPWNFGEPFYSVGTGGTKAAPKDATFLFARNLYQGQTFSGLNNIVQNMRVTVIQKINKVLQARVVANEFRGDVSGARTVMGGSTVNATTGDIQETQSYGGVSHYIKTFNAQADLVAIYDLGPIENSTLIGSEYIWNYDYEQDYTGVLPNFDLIHPVYGIFPATITQSGKSLAQTNQEGYFAQQQSKFFKDRVVLTAGIRYDRAWITTWNYLTNTFTRTNADQEDWVNAPRVGVTTALTKNFSAYGLWSTAQSPASQTREFPSSTTDFTILTTEQIAKIKELGFKGDFWDGRFTVTAAYFDQAQVGFFESTVTSQGVTENIIVPGALARGMEIDTVAEPIKNLWIVSGFTHNFQYDFKATGVPTAVVPKDKFSSFLNYQVTKKLSVNFGGLYVGQQLSVNGAQIYKRGGQTEFNAGIGYAFSKKWIASLAVQNLTDKLFVTSLVSTTSNTVGPDRNFKVTLIRKW